MCKDEAFDSVTNSDNRGLQTLTKHGHDVIIQTVSDTDCILNGEYYSV